MKKKEKVDLKVKDMEKKDKSKVDLKAKIKEMENSKRKAVPVVADKKVSFDSWHHLRSSKIPKQHLKEIIAADFKSRGLGKEATMEEFDKALKLYGVKL